MTYITVPVYLFRVSPVSATTYSLFIVGTSSLTGVIPQYRQGLLDVKTALLFGAPSIVTVLVTRIFLLPFFIMGILPSPGHCC